MIVIALVLVHSGIANDALSVCVWALAEGSPYVGLPHCKMRTWGSLTETLPGQFKKYLIINADIAGSAQHKDASMLAGQF
jgi:hypothetical protein